MWVGLSTPIRENAKRTQGVLRYGAGPTAERDAKRETMAKRHYPQNAAMEEKTPKPQREESAVTDATEETSESVVIALYPHL